MPAPTSKIQAAKGTRDFFPVEMAARRHVEAAWRSASIDCGFEEIDGPTFEHLELYTIKSGEGIVNELFSFTRAGGESTYALRPEFTPTLARMVAAKGSQLPMPIKWFCMPMMFRAEKPQRGRLREFQQWNVDLIGVDGAAADVEVISVAILALERLGLRPTDVQVRISHRSVVARMLIRLGVPEDRVTEAMGLLDRRAKLSPALFKAECEKVGLTELAVRWNEVMERASADMFDPRWQFDPMFLGGAGNELYELATRLEAAGLREWCKWDWSIVRGLAYYTGTVFEIHEITGAERAVAGGGRYDSLVELFGGPKMPACGFGMGDVVLSLVLADRGLLKSDELLPRPDAFLLSNGGEAAERMLPQLLASLRRAGLHARQSYKTTRNIGKLLGDAAKCRSRFAVILDERLAEGLVTVKDLDAGSQGEVPLAGLAERLRSPVG